MYSSLDAVAAAVARADPFMIDSNVYRAYEAGATVAQVLAAIEVGQCSGHVPPGILGLARTAAQEWIRIAAPGLARRIPASWTNLTRRRAARAAARPQRPIAA